MLHSPRRTTQRCQVGEEKHTWLQGFTVSRIEQTFRRLVLRRRLIDDPEYAHLLQREHHKLQATGFKREKKESKRAGLSPGGLQGSIVNALKHYDEKKYRADSM